ncbi:unnamed protein product [Closterium sp. Yama58-4]|nr:unnamed protein product [Closterium sp. Yama58-4]
MRGFHGKRTREAFAWNGEATGAGARGANEAAENAREEILFPGRYVSKRERLRMDGQKKGFSTHGQPIDKISAENVARETATNKGALLDAPDWIRNAAANQEGAAERFVVPRRLMCRI